MPKIEITELDLTTPGGSAESTDIVYIPGFVVPDQAIIEFGKPELFTSVAAFNTRCGKTAPKFDADQMYPVAFDPAAKNGLSSDPIMFSAGTADPSYVMAKELLAAGMSVLFERVNQTANTEYELVDASNKENKEIIEAGNKGEQDWYYKVEVPVGDKVEYLYKSYNIPSNKDDIEQNSKIQPVYTSYIEGNIYKISKTYSINVDTMYDYLSNYAYIIDDIAGISDRGNYSVKYITSGGYPTFEYDSGNIVTKMLALAEKRGDCVALIDHIDNSARSIDPAEDDSVFKAINAKADSYSNGDFGAMFTPWATYNRTTSDTDASGKRTSSAFRAPASFAYLMALADSIKTNANWLAIAGAARGGILNLAENGMNVVIPNGVADTMQPRGEDNNKIAVNAITNIKPYGATIWGNRTLKPIEEDLVATSFLNVRNLISDIKKTCYRAARKSTFEQDTDILWVNFKSDIAKLLERMKSGYGISGYKIVRDHDHAEATKKATLCAKIIIYPTYAVEDFYITVVLQDNEVSVD